MIQTQGALNSISMMQSLLLFEGVVLTFFFAANSVMSPNASFTVAGPSIRIM